MIVLKKSRLIIATPPKCGSTSLHAQFCEQQDNVFVIGPQFGTDEINKHTMSIPFEYRKYRRAMTVRNPFTRAISLWSYHCGWNGEQSFENYLEWSVSTAEVYGFYRYRLFEFADEWEGDQFDYLKLEHLDEGLRSYDLDFDILPMLNVGDHETPEELYTDETADLVRKHHAEDFKRFDYSLDLNEIET